MYLSFHFLLYSLFILIHFRQTLVNRFISHHSHIKFFLKAHSTEGDVVVVVVVVVVVCVVEGLV